MLNIIGFDVETAKAPNHFPWRENFYLTTISISLPNNVNLSWMFHHETLSNVDYNKNFKEIQTYLDKADYIAAHNIKFDLNVVRNHLKFPKLWCTQIAEYLLKYQIQNRNLKLNDLASKYGLPPKLDKVKDMWDAGYDTAEIPISLLKEYCEDDAYKARYIAEKQYTKINSTGLLRCFSLQMEWLDVLSEMECNGVGWDTAQADKILSTYKRYSAILERSILKYVTPLLNGQTVNLGSSEDLSVILYGGSFLRKEKVPVIKTKNVKVQMPYIFTYKDGTKKIKTKWSMHPDTKIIRQVYGTKTYAIDGLGIKPLSKTEIAKHTDERPLYRTDKNTLPLLQTTTTKQKAVIALLLRKSSIDKVISTFYNETKQTGLVSKITRDGKLHTNYNQAVTATGRLSSSDPNSQNLPRGNTSPIKTCIIPVADGIMNADISQIELRVPAQLSQDPVMVKEFQDDEDLHANNCVATLKLPLNKLNRTYTKIFNFRMIYGGTEYGFWKDPKMPNFKLTEWRDIINVFFTRYAGLKSYNDQNIQHVIDGDGTLVLPTGRRFKFKTTCNGKYDERQIKNYPIQGIAGGDILPLAAVIIRKAMYKRKMKSKIILTVHDSLVFDYYDNEKKALAKLCLKVFNNLPKYIKAYWGYDWIVPIKGEVECGNNYGNLSLYLK